MALHSHISDLFNPQLFLKYILNSCYMPYIVRGTAVINMVILLAFCGQGEGREINIKETINTYNYKGF